MGKLRFGINVKISIISFLFIFPKVKTIFSGEHKDLVSVKSKKDNNSNNSFSYMFYNLLRNKYTFYLFN